MAVAAVVVLTGGVITAGPARADDPPVDPPVRCTDVGIIGGSITVGSEGTQGQELLDVGILHWRIDARIGRQITRKKTGGIAVLQHWRATGYDPDCLVIALGTNDIPYYNTPSIYLNWIKQMMDAIGPTPRVLWVNVYRGKSRVRDDVFNGQLLVAEQEYANLQIADWFTLVSAHKDWLYADQVHPKSVGQRARSRWLALEIWNKLNGGGPVDGRPPASCTVVTVPLVRGMKNADVLCLETRLHQLLYFSKRADTKFDYSTKSALSNWQKQHSLPITGVLDDVTRDALGLTPPPPGP
jgi:hypothetical protein